MKKYLVILVAVVASMSMSAQADSFQPSNSCNKPYKPYRFEDEWAIKRFKDEVEEYKGCIEDFVDEQNEEANNHKRAAQEAIEEWNRYVRFDLN